MRLKGRRILITGAGAGIGKATAELFAREGAALALLDNDGPRLDAVTEELSNAPQAIVSACTDVADEAAVGFGVESAARALDGLDGLVNSAGVDLETPFESMTLAEWHHVLSVDLTGPMLVCRAALPALIAAGGGSIVNISSAAGLRPLVGRAAYCAAKAGLVMLGKALAQEFAERGLRVNTICPGAIDTPLFRGGLDEARGVTRESVKGRYAMQRIGAPEEIAEAALFLISHESSLVTGTALAVDGGRAFH